MRVVRRFTGVVNIDGAATGEDDRGAETVDGVGVAADAADGGDDFLRGVWRSQPFRHTNQPRF